jgi:colicin import membrane protein
MMRGTRLGALLLFLLGAAPGSAQEVEGEVRNLTAIGFQQFADGSRLFVRTNEPVKYRIESTQADVVTLVLDNTRIPLRNNARALDTRYFDSPVSYIQPKVIEDVSPSVRIDIRLRRRVPYKETQTETLVALDFPRR